MNEGRQDIQFFVLGNQLAKSALIFFWDPAAKSKPVVNWVGKLRVDEEQFEVEEEVYLRSRSSMASSSSDG